MQKLEDQPDLDQHCMHQAFEGLREPHHNEAFFTAWCAGQTGYPFIDACMRNLNHNIDHVSIADDNTSMHPADTVIPFSSLFSNVSICAPSSVAVIASHVV